MKIPSKRQFCGYCDLPVMYHKNSTGFIDGVLYHKRRCYPKHLKEVRKRERKYAKKSDLLHRVPTRMGADRRDSGAAGQQGSHDPRVLEVSRNSG